ncbi:hypothetical protein LX32DRAFT_648388 [Colletotrichum zoysiae]|uniref:Uncharacterized protein n=1 Tax=Colletotrichum zoysiae TaxID=1216348 RepID=A0AAD9HV08_9PEZI|nr:hypothetical protein LX32DRAFT_648388 [Colletotrichum zoysiae]
MPCSRFLPLVSCAAYTPRAFPCATETQEEKKCAGRNIETLVSLPSLVTSYNSFPCESQKFYFYYWNPTNRTHSRIPPKTTLGAKVEWNATGQADDEWSRRALYEKMTRNLYPASICVLI